MRRLLIASFAGLGLAAVLGVAAASAQVDVQLNIKNQSTDESGNNIHATTGQKVKFTLTVKNLSSKKQDVTVTVVGGIPGCMIREVRTVHFAPKETKKEFVSGPVPAGKSGLLTVQATAVLAGGSSDTDSGSVAFGPAKLASGRVFYDVFVRMLVRGLLAALESDDASVSTLSSMGDFKSLYR